MPRQLAWHSIDIPSTLKLKLIITCIANNKKTTTIGYSVYLLSNGTSQFARCRPQGCVEPVHGLKCIHDRVNHAVKCGTV